MYAQLPEENKNFQKILVIDIETVAAVKEFSELPEVMQKQWERKSKLIQYKETEILNAEETYKTKAGIYAEFGKVVCIGLGIFNKRNNDWEIRLKSICNKDEKALLIEFVNVLQHLEKKYKEVIFCGHNIKEFDMPYLCRRMLINGMRLPKSLQLSGKKPWEIHHLDTLELWRFGDYKHYTSLELIAAVMGIETPKDDIDGSMVNSVFWEEENLDRIGTYCLKDVLTTSKVILKLMGKHNIELKVAFK